MPADLSPRPVASDVREIATRRTRRVVSVAVIPFVFVIALPAVQGLRLLGGSL